MCWVMILERDVATRCTEPTLARSSGGAHLQAARRGAIACQGALGIAESPIQHLGSIVADATGIGRIAGTVHELTGVAPEVEEERRQSGEMHILVVLVLDHGERA